MTNPSPGLTRRDLLRTALTVVAVLVLLQFVWETRLLLLLTMLGVLLGVAATPVVDWLEARRVRRAAGAPLVVLGLLAAFVAVMLLTGPTMVKQIDALRVQLPLAVDRFDAYLASQHSTLVDAILPPSAADSSATGAPSEASGRLRTLLSSNLGPVRAILFGAVSSTFAVVAGFIFVLFLTIYFAIAPSTYRSGVLLLVPPEGREKGAKVYDAVVMTLRKWLSTQFIAMLAIGTITTVGLLLLGVKSALPLGIIAGLLEFIPNVGPLLSAVPAILIAFADAPSKALAVGLLYWGIQFLENNLLIPYLMQEELDLPPALTLLWQALMAIVFGFVGLFIAVPLLAAIMVAVRMLYVRGAVPAHTPPRGSRAIVAISHDDDDDRPWL
jgi:predicted PurR-regulated permease PerM